MIVDGLIIMCLIDVYHMNLIMYFAIHQEWEVTVCNSWITFIYFVEQGHVSIIQLNHVDSTWFYQILILLSFPAVTTDFTFSFNFFFSQEKSSSRNTGELVGRTWPHIIGGEQIYYLYEIRSFAICLIRTCVDTNLWSDYITYTWVRCLVKNNSITVITKASRVKLHDKTCS